MVKEDEDHLKVFEKLFVHLIREYTHKTKKLDKIQRKKGDVWGEKTGGRDHNGLYEVERQIQGSNCQGISVKKMHYRKNRGTRVMGEKTASSQKRKYKIGKQVKSLGNQ